MWCPLILSFSTPPPFPKGMLKIHSGQASAQQTVLTIPANQLKQLGVSSSSGGGLQTILMPVSKGEGLHVLWDTRAVDLGWRGSTPALPGSGGLTQGPHKLGSALHRHCFQAGLICCLSVMA